MHRRLRETDPLHLTSDNLTRQPQSRLPLMHLLGDMSTYIAPRALTWLQTWPASLRAATRMFPPGTGGSPTSVSSHTAVTPVHGMHLKQDMTTDLAPIVGTESRCASRNTRPSCFVCYSANNASLSWPGEHPSHQDYGRGISEPCPPRISKDQQSPPHSSPSQFPSQHSHRAFLA